MLARVGTAAIIAQPQADEVALAVGVGGVDESSAAVAKRPVMDELDLPRLEIEIDRQCVLVEDVEHCRDRRLAIVIDRLAQQGVSAVDLVGAEARLQSPGVLEYGVLEYGRGKDCALVRPIFALAVEPERPVEPFQPVGIALLQYIVHGVKADHAAVPTAA